MPIVHPIDLGFADAAVTGAHALDQPGQFRIAGQQSGDLLVQKVLAANAGLTALATIDSLHHAAAIHHPYGDGDLLTDQGEGSGGLIPGARSPRCQALMQQQSQHPQAQQRRAPGHCHRGSQLGPRKHPEPAQGEAQTDQQPLHRGTTQE